MAGVVAVDPAVVLEEEVLEAPTAADVALAAPLTATAPEFDEEPPFEVPPPSCEIRFCSICTRPLPPP